MYKLVDWLHSLIVWVADHGEVLGVDSGWSWGAHLGDDRLLSCSYAVDLSNNYSAAHLFTVLVDITISDEVDGWLLCVSINNPMADMYLKEVSNA